MLASSAAVPQEAAPFPLGVAGRSGDLKEYRGDLVRQSTVGFRKPLPVKRQVRLVARHQIGFDQIVLAFEMVVDGFFGDARLLRDVVEADSTNSFRVEQFVGGRQYPVACTIGLFAHAQSILTSEYTSTITPISLSSFRRNQGIEEMTDTVLFEQNGAIALLTINRPGKLNALNYTTNDLILHHLDEIEQNEHHTGRCDNRRRQQGVFRWW